MTAKSNDKTLDSVRTFVLFGTYVVRWHYADVFARKSCCIQLISCMLPIRIAQISKPKVKPHAKVPFLVQNTPENGHLLTKSGFSKFPKRAKIDYSDVNLLNRKMVVTKMLTKSGLLTILRLTKSGFHCI